MTITTFKRIYGYAMVIFVAVALLGCDSGQSSKNTSNEKNTAASTSYMLTDHEKNILKIILIDEMKINTEGGEVAFPDLSKKIIGDFVTTTSDELQKEYERNEVAGDRAFRKKTIFVKGIVKSIDRSVGENYFISLKGGTNSFIEPKASMADGYTDFLAELEKGNEVSLVCVGNGMLIGSAMLSTCEPLLNYASRTVNNFVDNINLGDVVAKKDKSTATVSVAAIAIAAILPELSTCFSSEFYEDKCLAEIKEVSNNKNKEAAAAFDITMLNSLKKIGLNKDALKGFN